MVGEEAVTVVPFFKSSVPEKCCLLTSSSTYGLKLYSVGNKMSAQLPASRNNTTEVFEFILIYKGFPNTLIKLTINCPTPSREMPDETSLASFTALPAVLWQ